MEHSCEVYPQIILSGSVSENLLSPNDDHQYFIIKVHYNENFCVPRDLNSSGAICYTRVLVSSDLPKDEVEQETREMLSYLRVPEETRDFMAAKILSCADHMANVTHTEYKILRMTVFMSVTWYDEDDQVVQEAMENQGHGLVPACKSAIDELERVKVMEKCNCTICLGDFEVDSKGVRMPCLHLFHENCIVNWLQNGHCCPLCRFQMPTSKSE